MLRPEQITSVLFRVPYQTKDAPICKETQDEELCRNTRLEAIQGWVDENSGVRQQVGIANNVVLVVSTRDGHAVALFPSSKTCWTLEKYRVAIALPY